MIVDGVVDNLIIADTKEIAEEVTNLLCVQADDTVRIGTRFDGTSFIIEEAPSDESA